jgi:hypothetical protein
MPLPRGMLLEGCAESSRSKSLTPKCSYHRTYKGGRRERGTAGRPGKGKGQCDQPTVHYGGRLVVARGPWAGAVHWASVRYETPDPTWA